MLINEDPLDQPVKKPDEVRIFKPEYKGVTVDTNYNPMRTLITHIEGQRWNVNYYQQVLDRDNDLSGQAVNRKAPDQQYRLIEGFELRVQTPLTTSQNEESKSMQVTGTAMVVPELVPNTGDMFLADIGDGREGIFQITLSDRRTIFKDTAHYIEYTLVDYSTPERRLDLKRKTVHTLVYNKDFKYHGQSPLLEVDDHLSVTQLQAYKEDLTLQYFRSFFSREFKTLILPGQEDPTYDPMFTKFCRSFFVTEDAPEVQELRVQNVEDDNALRCVTVLDVIRNQDAKLMRFVNEEVGLVYARQFSRDPMFEGIFHSGLKRIVYPKDEELHIDYGIISRSKTLIGVRLTPTLPRPGRMEMLANMNDLSGLPYAGAPLISDVDPNSDYYIFSEKFYANEEGQSKFELCVKDYINRKSLNLQLLAAFCESYHSWGGLERYYLTPILLVMINSAIRSI